MNNPDLIEAVHPVIKTLEALAIPYYIGGSIASSLYGIARATMDVDLVADIKIEHIASLKTSLENKYYIDEEMVAEAVRQRSSFNLIHLETMIKIDMFVFKDEPYQKEALKRKRRDTFEEGQTSIEFYFSSAEDIILNKLLWYEMGEKVSERQWYDLIGVIKVQSTLLDKEYLKRWATTLDLMDLLVKAYTDAGIYL
jgi:hypothetical protein